MSRALDFVNLRYSVEVLENQMILCIVNKDIIFFNLQKHLSVIAVNMRGI